MRHCNLRCGPHSASPFLHELFLKSLRLFTWVKVTYMRKDSQNLALHILLRGLPRHYLGCGAVCAFSGTKTGLQLFFSEKVLTSASPICFLQFAPQPRWMDGLSLCPCVWAARYQPRSAPTRCNSPGRVQSEFPFQIWSSSLRPLFHLRLKHILP